MDVSSKTVVMINVCA
ncbi:TPA: stress response membrane protein YncL, partial [Klebsiella pneumoniae]|nr:stress response membrane protein YncL [Klebsiella pneumoniae]